MGRHTRLGAALLALLALLLTVGFHVWVVPLRLGRPTTSGSSHWC